MPDEPVTLDDCFYRPEAREARDAGRRPEGRQEEPQATYHEVKAAHEGTGAPVTPDELAIIADHKKRGWRKSREVTTDVPAKVPSHDAVALLRSTAAQATSQIGPSLEVLAADPLSAQAMNHATRVRSLIDRVIEAQKRATGRETDGGRVEA